MNTVIGLIKYPLIAGVLAMAVARARDLAWWDRAIHKGKCVWCDEWFNEGAAIRRVDEGWIADCCSDRAS